MILLPLSPEDYKYAPPLLVPVAIRLSEPQFSYHERGIVAVSTHKAVVRINKLIDANAQSMLIS
jgi:hypothetical protein